MNDKKQPGDKKTSGAARGGRLELKRPVDVGARAGAGGGRSSSVQVEVRKKRGPKRDERPAAETRGRQEKSPIAIKQGSEGGKSRRDNRNRGDQTRGRMVLPKLTDDEKARRTQALRANMVVQAERRKKAEEEARIRAVEDERRRIEEAEAAKRAAEEEERRREEEAARRKAEEEAERRRAEEDARNRKAEEAVSRARTEKGDDRSASRDGAPRRDGAGPRRDGTGPRRDGAGPRRDGTGPRRDGAGPRRDGAGPRPAAGGARPAGAPGARPGADAGADDRNKGGGRPPRRGAGGKQNQSPARPQQTRGKPGGDRRRGGRLTVSQAMSDNDPRQKSLAAMRRRQQRGRNAQEKPEAQHIVRDVIVPESITVGELANRMAVRSTDVVKSLMKLGVMATINQVVDADTAELVVEEFGHNMKRVADSDVEIAVDLPDDGENTLKSRPPVVTVMGHVDHGKTSVLDALRSASVVAREAGGITQHIGAYQIETGAGQKITFIDTPGHAAFTSMRSRGAKVTDIVVLVVSADDSVMPQTVEAINHAKAAEVPIIVAVNKIDKPDSNPNKVKQDLLQHEVFVEDLGGEVLCVEISALKGTNLDKLIDAINLQAEFLELKANPDRTGNGSVVEAQLEQGRGAVGTVLVQGGTLKVGDIFVAGATYGRIRALIDDHGQRIQEAPPSCPVEVLGFQDAPEAGDDFVVLGDEAKAREIAEFRQRKAKENRNTAGARGTLEQMLSAIKEGKAAEMPILIKGDVQGSVEAITAAAEKISTNEVKAQILHSGVGGITETDVTLAQSAGAVIFGFNTRPNKQAREAADREGVDIRYYNVIYELTDDLKALMAGLLSPDRQENTLGMAEVRQVFNITKVGKIAGCLVTEGQVKRNAHFRQQRDGIVLHEGVIANLKHYKDEVSEVRVGSECGIAFENHQDIQEGDQIEVFEIKEVARTL